MFEVVLETGSFMMFIILIPSDSLFIFEGEYIDGFILSNGADSNDGFSTDTLDNLDLLFLIVEIEREIIYFPIDASQVDHIRVFGNAGRCYDLFDVALPKNFKLDIRCAQINNEG